jgi:hypothetical protein
MIWLSVKRDVFMQNFQNLGLENSTDKHASLVGDYRIAFEVGIRRLPKMRYRA